MINSPVLRISAFFAAPDARRRLYGLTAHAVVLVAATGAALLYGGGAAHSGPCTAQIAQLEREMGRTAPGPESGPTAPQTVDAQLHRQPTPGDVVHAERKANADADAALALAKEANDNGNATGCHDALTEARRLYGLP